MQMSQVFSRLSAPLRSRLCCRAAILVCALMACALVQCTSAQRLDSKATEFQLKAAYLYNFGQFVVWPEKETTGVFRLCVLGQDPFGAVLDSTVAGGRIGGGAVV